MDLQFEWDEAKCALNLEKHGIDFEDAIAIWEGPIQVRPSHRSGESRWIAVGLVETLEVAVVYTERNGVKRLISARRARRNERKTYREAFPE